MKNKTPRYDNHDFSAIDGLLIPIGDPEVPPQILDRTPAVVEQKSDKKTYQAVGLYYDGDSKGFVVTINTDEGLLDLRPGEYRTHALFDWDDDAKKLRLLLLD